MTTPIIEDSGSSTYTYQGNNFNQLTINGKQISYFRDENPSVNTEWNWTNLFNLWDNLIAIKSSQSSTVLKVVDTLRLADASDTTIRNITPTSNPATTIDVLSNPDENFEYNITMIRSTAGNNKDLYVDSAGNLITYNGSLGQLTCNQFLGNVHSQANSANATHYLTFVDTASTGFQRLQKNSGLSYNPNTNILTAGTFSGTATNATNVNITNADVNATYYPVLSTGTGNQALIIDSVTTPLSYNPNTATLSVGNTTVATGSITTATGSISTRLNLSYANSTGTFSSGTLTLNAGATRSFQNFTFTMTANITALTLTNLGTNGSFNLFITGHSTTDYTIGIGGTGNLGGNILTSWSTAQTITANSRNLITIHFDSAGDKFYLRGTFGFTG